jgi:hypothetical protein
MKGAYDSRPMPRASNHITALAEQHEKQSQKIAELERVIAHVSTQSSFTVLVLISSYRTPLLAWTKHRLVQQHLNLRLLRNRHRQ